MLKKMNLSAKLIIIFLIAIIGSILICAISTYKSAEVVFSENMELTTDQTIDTSLDSLQTYEKTLSLPVDLLTRKDSVKKLYVEPENYEKYISNVQDELIAATKVLDGSARAFYATAYGDIIYGWIYYDEEGKKKNASEIVKGDLTGEEWYVASQGRKAKVNAIFSYITMPHYDEFCGEDVITVCQEVKTNDEVQGVVGLDIKLSYIEAYINSTKLLNTGFTALADENGNFIVNNEQNKYFSAASDLDIWNDCLSQISILEEQKIQLLSSENEADVEVAKDIVLKYSGTQKIGGKDAIIEVVKDEVTNWYLIGFISDEENSVSLGKINTAIAIASIFGIIFGIVIAISVATVEIREIKRIQTATERVAEGDFTQQIEIRRYDEFGKLETNFNKMIADVSSLIKQVDEKAINILEVSEKISDIAGDTRNTMQEVSEAIGTVAVGAQNQATSTHDATGDVDALNESLEATKDYVEEINSMTQETTKLSASGLTSVHDLIEKAERTSEKSKISLSVMNEMIESINKIYYISDAIADITSQTNLLSLNASIEAARAGEAGKGFAVVADEIRNLAEESRKSTDEIKDIIAEITDKSKEVETAMLDSENLQAEQQDAITNTEALFSEIIEQINKLSAGIERINELNAHMANNSDQVVSRMNSIAQVSEESAATTEKVNASADQVNDTMEDINVYTSNLTLISSELKNLIGEFKLME